MTEATFLGIPEWALDDPHWWCPNGHVSTRYLKSEERGDLCLACMEPVRLVVRREDLPEGVYPRATVEDIKR